VRARAEEIRTKRDNKNNYVLRSCIIIYENHREKERFVIFIYKNFLIIEASERLPAWLASWEDRSGPAPFILQKSCLSMSRSLGRPAPAGYMHICAMYFLSNKHTTRLPCFLSLTAIVLSAHGAPERKKMRCWR
jgi:hypothetical protein